MKTRLMTLVVMMAVSISSFSVMAQNAQDVPAHRADDGPTCKDDGEETCNG